MGWEGPRRLRKEAKRRRDSETERQRDRETAERELERGWKGRPRLDSPGMRVKPHMFDTGVMSRASTRSFTSARDHSGCVRLKNDSSMILRELVESERAAASATCTQMIAHGVERAAPWPGFRQGRGGRREIQRERGGEQ